MTDYASMPYGRVHPPHSLVAWPAILAGAAVAVAVGAMLNLLGVALGAGGLNPFALSREDAAEFTVGAGIWMAIANALALFVGGYVASRAAKYADHHRGLLNGLAVWAVSFLLAILIAGSTVAGGVNAALQGAAEQAPVVIDQRLDPLPPGEAVPAIPPEAQVAAENAADMTSTVALWGFLSMLLCAAAAVFGGRFGVKGRSLIEHEPLPAKI